MKTPIEIFSQWAEIGKDEGMEKNHYKPVQKMLKLIKVSEDKFSFIDAGCGNGWVTRQVSKEKNCFKSIGVDGSKLMIKKAKKIDSINEYYIGDLLDWKPYEKVDYVFSMEVLYYFEKPINVLKNIRKNWLKNNGVFIMGIDFYYENTSCHNWQNETGVSIMNLMKIKGWEDLFNEVGFKKIKTHQFCKSDDWEGTLVIVGSK